MADYRANYRIDEVHDQRDQREQDRERQPRGREQPLPQIGMFAEHRDSLRHVRGAARQLAHAATVALHFELSAGEDVVRTVGICAPIAGDQGSDARVSDFIAAAVRRVTIDFESTTARWRSQITPRELDPSSLG